MDIIHAVGRIFVDNAYTPLLSLERRDAFIHAITERI
jgi:hypothetical protein